MLLINNVSFHWHLFDNQEVINMRCQTLSCCLWWIYDDAIATFGIFVFKSLDSYVICDLFFNRLFAYSSSLTFSSYFCRMSSKFQAVVLNLRWMLLSKGQYIRAFTSRMFEVCHGEHGQSGYCMFHVGGSISKDEKWGKYPAGNQPYTVVVVYTFLSNGPFWGLMSPSTIFTMCTES